MLCTSEMDVGSFELLLDFGLLQPGEKNTRTIYVKMNTSLMGHIQVSSKIFVAYSISGIRLIDNVDISDTRFVAKSAEYHDLKFKPMFDVEFKIQRISRMVLPGFEFSSICNSEYTDSVTRTDSWAIDAKVQSIGGCEIESIELNISEGSISNTHVSQYGTTRLGLLILVWPSLHRENMSFLLESRVSLLLPFPILEIGVMKIKWRLYRTF